jgi:hypothetical protein
MEKELNSQETRESIMRKRDIEFANMDESDYKNITDEWMDEFCGFVDITPPKEEKTFKTEITSDEEMDRFVGFVDEESELEDSSTPNGFEDEDSVVETEKKEDKSVESLSDEEFDALVAATEKNNVDIGKKTKSSNAIKIKNIYDINSLKGDLFPVEFFPDWAREMITEVSKSVGITRDYVAGSFLGAASALLCGKAKVESKAGWIEPLVLWVIAAGKTGIGKGGVFKYIMQPIRLYGKYILDSSLKRIEDQEKRIAYLKRKIKDFQRKKNRTPQEERELDKFTNELASTKPLGKVKLVTSDATLEACIKMMTRTNGRLIILDTEANQFKVMFGRYSKNNEKNYEAFLKGFSGELLDSDRITNDWITVENPSINFITSVQPDVIKQIFKDNLLESSGLIPRFLFFIGESTREDGSDYEYRIPDGIEQNYIKRCLKIAMRDTGTPDILCFDDEAKKYMKEVSKKNADRMKKDVNYSRILSFLERYDAQLVRIAAILHVLNNSDSQYWKMPVERDMVEKAYIIMENFVIPNIFNFYSITGANSTSDFLKIKKVVDWLKKNNKKAGNVVLAEEIRASVRKNFKNSEDFKETLFKIEATGNIELVRGPIKGIHKVIVKTDPDDMLESEE